MQWFVDLSMRWKLILSFSAIVAIFCATLAYQYLNLKALAAMQDEGNSRSANAVAVKQFEMFVDEVAAIAGDVVMNGNVQGARNEFSAAQKKFEENVKVLRSLVTEDQDRQSADVYVSSIGRLVERTGAVIDLVQRGESGGNTQAHLRTLHEELDAARSAADASAQALSESLRRRGVIADEEFDRSINESIAMLGAATAAAAILSMLLALAIARHVSHPIRQVIEVISHADLHTRFEATRKDEAGDLQRSFDAFVLTVKDTLLQVAQAAESVASATSEISSSTEEMAAGAQQQMSQSSEVASAVDALAKTIVENSGHASNASTIARKAREVAEQGKLVMHKMVDAMNEIAKVVNNSAETVSLLGRSSDQIGEITGVIDDIADQTNLLALNAAIEAARAGEQGRGFAVVADEVRKLAERTTTATKEIATMIQRIQEETRGAVQVMHEGNKRVSGGIELADRAGASLQEIVATSQEVTDTVTQIAAASEQQSSASEEISKNIAAISHVSHETAAGTQQLARAADDLNRLTETLQSALSRFKLSANTQSAARNGIVPEMSRVAVRASGMLVPSEG